MRIPAPAPGTLQVQIDERGLTLVSLLDERPSTEATSPVERFGTIVLLTSTLAGQLHTVRIRPHDSPEMQGEFCLRARLLPRDDPALAEPLAAFAQGGQATQKQNWQAAFDAYLKAARGFDAVGLRVDAGQARQALAELAYRRFDRKRDAYALTAEALADYGERADPITKGLLTGLRASALLAMPGTEPRAEGARVRELLAGARRYDSASPAGARELPRLDIMTGFLEYTLDAPARAQAAFTQAAEHCRKTRDWGCYAVATQNLALLQESSNYDSALQAYTQALRLLPVGLEPRLRADISNNLGRLQGVVGLFSASQRSHEAAMHEYAQLGDCPGVRRSMSRLGTLMTQLGVVGDAESYLQRAASFDCADLLSAAGTPQSGLTQPAASDLPIPQRNSAGAATPHRSLCVHPIDAEGLASENRIVVFNSLLSLGNVLMMEGELSQAQRCFQTARLYAADSRTQVRLENASGAMLLERADAAGARAAFNQALHIADVARLSSTYEHRGAARLGMVKAALLAGDAGDAMRQSYQTLRSSVLRGDVDQTVTSLRLLAAAYRGSRPQEAARTLLTAADLIEAVPIDQLDGEKRATYLATQYSVFADLTDLFASQAETDRDLAWRAFSTSERGRARSLRYAVTQATRAAADSAAPPPTARYREMLREAAQLTHADTAEPAEGLVQQLDNLAQHERGATQPLDRESLLRTLDELSATLVEYAAGTQDMFAFVVHDGAVQVIRLAGRREIATASAELLERLRDPETPANTVRQAATKLARLVLWPVHAALSGKRIVFVPDDALHTVPFTVLPWSASDSDQLVLQHAEVTVLPSARFLLRRPDRGSHRDDAPRVKLIGDPVFGLTRWRRECLNGGAEASPAPPATRSAVDWLDSLPRLPGSRSEVLSIAKLMQEARPGARVDLALGCAAVPEALRRGAESAELLHIATHARVDAQRPRLSALALTPEAGDEASSAFGLLDILGLKLNSSLVVLSACDTSRGRLLPGEGVLGPAQAFLEAGAAAVIASYWRVDDQATAAFMQQFYRHLLLDRLPASRALRQAQLERASSSSSYAWAAFALYGWPDSSI
ncbi:MAG TPA: CHAT domain-containing protein [Steroidobacteraceae bacterium]|nr:CHAT domain-containing protein [Steroidobacteraceae bacterium]